MTFLDKDIDDCSLHNPLPPEAARMEHGPAYVKELVREHIQTDEQPRQCAAAFTRFMAQHVRVHNEIYGCLLSEVELRSYDRPGGGAA